MKNRVIKIGRDKAVEIMEGNQVLCFFMGDNTVREKSYYFSSLVYHTSWDALMEVIKKIKQCVFADGYDLFMPEHSRYISIGNACYDADLTGAWIAAVRWVQLRNDLQDYDFVRDEGDNDFIIHKTKNETGLIISPHAIRRWKQRISELDSVDKICDRLSTKKLWTAYNEGGNGKYYIGDGLIVAIDEYLIITVYKGSGDEGIEPYTKIKELSKKTEVDHFLNKYYGN